MPDRILKYTVMGGNRKDEKSQGDKSRVDKEEQEMDYRHKEEKAELKRLRKDVGGKGEVKPLNHSPRSVSHTHTLTHSHTYMHEL